jgi:hypothetical protein
MAIGAQENALPQLLSDLLPAPRIAAAGDAELLSLRAEMVELQGVRAPIVSADLTPAALGGERLAAQLAASALDGLNQVLAAIGIRPTICHPFTPFLQPLALPVELPGNEVTTF